MMINKLLALVFLFSLSNLVAQTTPIPDANFEQKLITLGIDTNGANGNILNSDALAQTTLALTGNTAINFTGLEAFVNLITLNTGNNLFSTLPLTNLLVLENFTSTNNSDLNTLNFLQNVALKNVEIRASFTVGLAPPITSLDFSANLNLIKINIQALISVNSLILPVTSSLKDIKIRRLNDATLNFAQCSGLEFLDVMESIINTTITLPNVFTVLKKLTINSINIPNINLSNYTNLESIYLWGTYVQNLQLPNSTTLDDIFVIIHDIQNPISFASLPNLKKLDFTSCLLTPLVVNLTQNILLETLNLGANKMTSINLTQNINLKNVRLSNNNLTSLNVTQNTLLEDLAAGQNQLPTINVSQNLLLESLELNFNLLPTLNVTANNVLRYIDISNNLFTTTGLDLTMCPALTGINASFNQISSLNITQNPIMSYLRVDHNLFAGNNDIIQQYYDIRASNGGIVASQLLDVSFNQLSGPIPNLASLISLNTNYFKLFFHNNAFQFGNFENNHNQYVQFLSQNNLFGGYPLPIMTEYWYAPQAKVNPIQTTTITAGTPITLTTTVSGSQNHYKWFKNNVAIVGAPDSPNYVITSANPCDSGVYYCEVRSDLVPFENTNPSGTSGKNLLLVRNNITLNVTPVAASCSSLILPLNGAVNVGINTVITWTDTPNACGYRLDIGTTSGGTQILNNVDVGNVNSYSLVANLPINTIIYVEIKPYYSNATSSTCPVQSFKTGTNVLAVPTCVTAVNPLNNAINIPVNQNFSWTPVASATGYTVIMGTTPGGSQIPGTMTGSSFNPTPNLPQGQIIYLTITPFNADGNAVGCSVFQFTVEVIPNPPTCPVSYSIANNSTNVSINTGGISWPSVSSQTEYYVTIGTTPTGTQYESNFFNNTSEYYSVPTPFAYSTTYYFRIRVRDQSTGNYGPICSTVVFTTESAPQVVPNCATNIFPANLSTNVLINANITWNAVATATGYRISIGTTSGGTDIVNNFNNGNSLTYNPTADFAQNTTYFVTITPYNSTGNATSCASESFTTQTIVTIPGCSTGISPANNAINSPVNSDISWQIVSNATGYFISIGTTSGGTNFVNNFDNGNNSIYNPTTYLASNTTYFVTITPYNSAGNAVGCSESQFTTQTIPVVPSCATNISPVNLATNVLVNANITWNAVANATGYRISIGTTSGGTDIVNNFNNGNLLIYNPASDFAQNTIYYVIITPYNATGSAVGCSEIQFTIEVIVEEIAEETIFIPRFFTPNGDGFNDFWQISDPKNEINRISIYDKFGKLLKNISGNENWNGTFANNILVADDYWFVIDKKIGTQTKGHFALKR